MRNMIALVALGLAGCLTVKAVPLPKGQTGYTIMNCSDMAQCYRKAAEVCGGDYELFSQNSDTSGSVIEGNGGIYSQFTITITCPNRNAPQKSATAPSATP